MSIRFVRTSSQSATSVGTIPTLAYPIYISVEFQPNDLTVEQAIVAITDADGDDYHAIIFKGTTVGNPVAARTRASGTNSDAESAVGIGSIGPNRVLVIFESDSSRSIYLNGTNLGTNTDTRSPTGLDRIQIGGRNSDLYASADVAEVAIWQGTTLTAAQIGQLNQGVHPLLVAPEALAVFTPLGAITPNPFKDEIEHLEFFLSGSPTLSSMGVSSVGFNQPVYPPPPVNVINAMVELILDLSTVNDTNLPNGYGVSDMDFSLEALNNIIMESASNDMGFSLEALNNIIEESITEVMGFSLEALNNIREESAANTFYLTPEALNNIRTGAAQNDMDFSLAVENNLFFESAESTIDFDVFGGIVKDASAENGLLLLQSGWSNAYFFSASNTLDFDIALAIDGTEHNLSTENTIWLTPSGHQTLEDSAENTIDLEPDAARGDKGTNTIDLTPEAVGVNSDPASNTLDLSQGVDREIERSLSAENDLDFQQGANPVLQPTTSCDYNEYNPISPFLPASITLSSPDTISLVCGSDSLTLKNPDFGNTDDLFPGRAFNVSRGLQPRACRESIWTRSQSKRFTVSNICDTDATGIVAFKRNCIGKEVTYTDMEGRAWVGFLVDQDPLVDNGPNRKSVSFEFRGVLASEKTWTSNP